MFTTLSARKAKQSIAFGLLLLAGIFTTSVSAQTVVNICDRTAVVETLILAAIPVPPACTAVTETQLAAITSLDLSNMSITALRSGDFANLTGLTTLRLQGNTFTTLLPANLFDDLPSAAVIEIDLAPIGDLTDIALTIGGTTTINIANAFISKDAMGSDRDLSFSTTLSGTSATATVNEDVVTITASSTITGDTDVSITANDGTNNIIRTISVMVMDICSRTAQVQTAILARISATNDCTAVTATQLTTITELNLRRNSITTLQSGDFIGLTSLRTLILRENALTTIEAGTFSSLTSLITLELNNNGLTTIEADTFSGLTNLVRLDLDFNALTTIEANAFSGLTSLITLVLSFNDLVTLEADTFSGLTSLTTLNLFDNTTLTTIEANTFSDLTSLTRLFLGGNSLTTIEADTFSALMSLTELNLASNNLTELPASAFDNLMSLTILDLRNNDLTTLEADTFSGLTSLVRLNLSFNGLTELPADIFSDLMSLTTLNLSFNGLTELPADIFSDIMSLGRLELDNNDLTTIEAGTFSALTSLTFLDLNDNDLTTIEAGTFSALTSLTFLDLTSNTLTTLPANAFSGLTILNDLRLSGNALTAIEANAFSGLTSLTELDLSFYALTTIEADTFSGLTSLITLDLRNNDLITLKAGAFSGLNNLTTLRLDENNLTTIEADIFSTLTILTTLRLSGNALTAIEADTFSGLNNLTTLRLDENNLTTIEADTFSALTSLTFLDLNDNNLTTIEADTFSALTSLTTLWLRNNSLTTIEANIFSGLNNLTTLLLDDNTLTTLKANAFSGLTSLTFLDLGSHALTTIEAGAFSGLTNLTILYLRNNDLTALPAGVFDNLTNLTELYLTNNALITIEAGTFSALANLTELRLSGNALTTLEANTFSGLMGLTELYLTHNDLTTIEAGAFSALTSLTILHLNDNALTALPAGVFDNLTSLTSLRLSANPITAPLPTDIFDPVSSASIWINLSPIGDLDEVALTVNGTTTINAANAFISRDLAGDDRTLSYTVTPANTAVATATESSGVVTITGAGAGATTVSVTANDGRGSTVGMYTRDIAVTVAEAGILAFDEATGDAIATLVATENGGTDTFYVQLASQPAGNVTLSVVSSDINEGTVNVASLTFTDTDWNTRQALTVMAVPDDIDRDDTFTVDFAVTTGDGANYPTSLVIPSVTVTVTDDDTAGIDAYDMATGGSEISAITTSEGGDAATFYVELTSQPTGTVTVTISGLVAGEHTLTTPASTTLTFTPTGTTAWNTRQEITLTGVDDNVVDGDQTYDLTLTPTGGGYDSVMAETVSITNTDDDTAAISIADMSVDENAGTATLTVTLTPAVTAGDVMVDLTTTDGTATTAGTDYTAFTSETLTIAEGSTTQTLDIPINNDNIDETDETFTVTLDNLMLPAAVTGDVTITDATATVTITDDDTLSDTINLSVSPLSVAETAGTTTITVTATIDGTAVSTMPTAVTVSVGGGTATSGTDYVAVSDFTLNIPALSSSGMATFMIDPTDDTTDDNNETVMISGTATGFTTINPATLTIVEAGISVHDAMTAGSQISTVTITEASSDTFYVELASAPANDVTLSIISDDTNEGMVTPATLTFTVMNWNTRQALTITSVDDNIDRDDSFMVDFMITSGDGGDYPDTLTLPSVTVTVTDDDTADIAVFDGATGDAVPDVTTTEGTTTEGPTTDTFYMVLTSQPTDTVSVTLTSGDTGEGLTRGNLLTFTTTDWNSRKAVTVFGQDDVDVDGDQTYDVILTARGGGYDGVIATVSVTNEDDDTARFSIIESSVAENAGTATLTVTLGIPVTAGDVSVDVTTMDATAEAGEDYTALVSETLTFAAGEMLQTLSVTINDDNIAEGNELFTVMLDNPIAPTATGVTASSVGILIANSLVLIRDDDTAGIAVFDAATDGNPLTAITTAEAGTTTNTFHVALTSQPTDTVTVTVTSSDPSEGTITTGDSLTFTAADWNSRQPIMVTGVNDNDVDGDIAYTVILRGTSTDTNYNGFLTAVNTTNTDDDTATLSIADLTIGEDAGTATVTVTLSAMVTAGDVMVDLTTADGTATSTDYTAITSQTLTFTAGSTSETLDITINDDNIAEVDETFTVMLGNLMLPAAVTGDVSITGATTTVTISDDDITPTGITLSVSQPTIADTADATEITVTATIDGTVVLAAPTDIRVSVGSATDSATEGTDYATVNDFDLTIPALSSSAMGTFTIDPNTSSTNGDMVTIDGTSGSFTITATTLTIVEAGISVFESQTSTASISTFTIAEASSDTFYVELASQPVSDVILTLTSSATGEGTVTPPTLTFTTMNWNARQALIVTAVDDNVDRDGDSFMVDFMVTSGTGNYDPATLTTLPSVAVTISDDDTAGITTAIGDGVTTSETGTSDTFTVVLDSEPTAEVTVEITGLDAGEHSLTPSLTLTFTTTDWNRVQTVTLTGVNDNDVDGNQTYALTLTATGGGYGGVTAETVSITNTDDDTATLSIADLTIGEDAGTATVTVTLSAMVTAGDVMVDLTTADGTATSTDYTAITSQTLTFTAGSTSETLDITINDDNIAEVDETFTVMLGNLMLPAAVTGDVSITGATTTVTISDDDTAGITTAIGDGVTTSETGTSDTFTVVLDSEPTAEVTVEITGLDAGEHSLTPSLTLTFTTTDWNRVQTVTLTGVNDNDVDGNQTYALTLTATGGGYGGVTAETVSITNTDDDTATLSIADLTIGEDAGTATVTVTLSAMVTAGDVMVDLTTADGTATSTDYTAITSQTLTFTAGSTSETLDITINDDNIAEVDETFTVMLGNLMLPAAVTGDVSITGATTTVTISDDDITPTGITLSVSQPTIADTADATEITVTATIDGTVVLAAPTDIRVSVGSATDSATEGTDYATVNDFDLTIPALSSSAMGTFTIDPNTSSTNGDMVTIDGTSGSFTITATTLTIVEAGISVFESQTSTASISTFTIAEASSDTFYVELASQPVSDVILTLTSSATGEGTVTPPTLTFTTMNWNARQALIVTAVDDNVDRDGDSFMVDFMVTSGTGNYDPATLTTLPSVAVTISDDDTASDTINLSISPPTVAETAGATTITVTATLSSAVVLTTPTVVTVTVGGTGDTADEGSDYMEIPDFILTIPALETSNNEVFSITPIADDENDNEETITISGTASINSNPATVNTATLTITGFSEEEQQVIEQTVAAQASSVTQVVSENIGSFLASRTSAPAAAPAPPTPDGGGGGDVNRENFTSIDWQDWQDRFAKLAYEGLKRLDSGTDMSLDWALKAASGGDGRLLMPLGIESLTLWAAGGRLKTKGDGMGEYDGGVNSFVVGVDTNLINNWLLGIAASYSDSQVDYTMDGAPIGTTEQNLFSVHPFLSHSLPEHGLTLWVTGGYGVGDIDFSHTTNGEAASDVTQWMAAGGIEKHIITNTLWQGALRLKGLWGNAVVDATAYDNGVDIRKVESTFWRARMESEMGYNFQLPGANVRPYALIGGRWDHNDAIVSGDEWHIDIGGGVEVLSGNAFALNISVHTQLTDGDTEEDSIVGTGSLTYDIGHDRQGLQITLSRPLNNTSPAWDQHSFNEVTDTVSGVNSAPLTSELAYGWTVRPFGLKGALQTYVQNSFDSDDRHYAVGLELVVNALTLNFESGYGEAENTGLEGMFKTKIRW